MKFTPEWVLKLTCACVAVNFVTGQLPMRSYGNRYAKDLLLMFDDTTGDKIEQITQDMLNKITGLAGGNAFNKEQRIIHIFRRFAPFI